MNRMWKYVKAVERKLPDVRRIQIAGELYADLKAQKQAREKELGRKLDDVEIDALLKATGEPDQVAARFASAVSSGSRELVERYLLAIERLLPTEGLKTYDILAELREVITAQIDDREEREGRELTRDELADLLKVYGTPEKVAYRYRERPVLIGEELSPYFWNAQRMVIGVVLAVVLGVRVVKSLGTERPVSAVIGSFNAMLEAAIFTFGLVTIIFLIADRWAPQMKLQRMWDPRALPETMIREPKSRFESLFALVFDAIFILWWTGLVTLPSKLPNNDGKLDAHFSAAWSDPVHTVVLGLAIAAAAAHVSDLLHPGWSRLRSLAAIVGCLVGIGVISVLFVGGDIIDVTGAAGYESQAARAEWWLNGIAKFSLTIVAFVWAIEVVVEGMRMQKSLRIRMPPAKRLA